MSSMSATHWTVMDSPVGEILLESDGEALTVVSMGPYRRPAGEPDDGSTKVLVEARRQLDAYFAGELTEFDLPLNPAGTPFQRSVWEQLARIPYASTTSYGAIAAAIGRPTAARAVGMANGRNPIGIIVPCHRVIGSGGALIGYAGGLDRKRTLLAMEAGRASRPAAEAP
jgi:methylated-DNA-[protein]-cysteine S-methyltransferase